MRLHFVATALLVLCACASQIPAKLDGGSDEGSDGGADAAIYDSTEYMPSCVSMTHNCGSLSPNPRCGQCQYRVRFERGQCSPDKPCDNLFLIWAAMDCSESVVQGAMDKVLTSRPGWVAACAQPAYPGEMLPTTLGAPTRDSAVMAALWQALKTDPATGVWSGKNLLMAGCSAGASRYPIVAARTNADDQWVGTMKTAACLSEGIYDVPFQDEFIGTGLQAGGASCQGRHRRIAEAYTVASVVAGHSCHSSAQGQCACDDAHATRRWPDSCGDGDCLKHDSIVVSTDAGVTFAGGVSGADFAVPNWKLVSEGSSFSAPTTRCEKDIAPAAPLAGLCELLEAAPATRCTYATFPEAPHCSAYWQNFNSECVDWFEKL